MRLLRPQIEADPPPKVQWVPSSMVGRFVLPRSLRSVAGAPRTARKKRPATPVGMTEWGKSEASQEGGVALADDRKRPT